MREQNTYSAMKSIVRERDFALQKSLNPNLGDFGTEFEAKQYSGVAANGPLMCPFQAIKEKKRSESQKARP